MGGEWQNTGDQARSGEFDEEASKLGEAPLAGAFIGLLAQAIDRNNPGGQFAGGFLDAAAQNVYGAAGADKQQLDIVATLAHDPKAVEILANRFCRPGEPHPQNEAEARDFLHAKLIGRPGEPPGLFAYMNKTQFNEWAQNPDKLVHTIGIVDKMAANKQGVEELAKAGGWNDLPANSTEAQRQKFLYEHVAPALMNLADASQYQKWDDNPVGMARRTMIINEIGNDPLKFAEVAGHLAKLDPTIQSFPGVLDSAQDKQQWLYKHLTGRLLTMSDQDYKGFRQYVNDPLGGLKHMFG